MRKRTQAREYALQILYQVDITGVPPQDVYADFWKANPCAQDIREFSELIAAGTVDKLKVIDDLLIKHAENWDLGRMAIVDRNILRLGTYELLFRDDIPPKVSINEAVNLAKKFSQEESGKFVNGVLDKICHAESNKLNRN